MKKKELSVTSGRERELFYSRIFHDDGPLPVLVSEQFLRIRGAGQIDIATFDVKRSKLHVFEVKKSGNLSPKQYHRLIHSQRILNSLFNSSSQLKVLS